ncbi:unnamed protein product [Linum trigynum]|uniref:Uncharacterized protein n=1 Tax=Linum trigynum TaxID=586398 RepID=A0AAV2FLW0_9ROSI
MLPSSRTRIHQSKIVLRISRHIVPISDCRVAALVNLSTKPILYTSNIGFIMWVLIGDLSSEFSSQCFSLLHLPAAWYAFCNSHKESAVMITCNHSQSDTSRRKNPSIKYLSLLSPQQDTSISPPLRLSWMEPQFAHGGYSSLVEKYARE